MGSIQNHRQFRTTIHGRSLLVPRHKLRTKLENDACRPPLYSKNKRTKPAPNLNPFSRRVSRTRMVTLAHIYILTRTPHMCARTDFCVYTSMKTPCTYTQIYTPTQVNSVYLYMYMNTNTCKLCAYIRNHIHTHPNSVDIYANIYTPKCKRRVHIHVYRHTHIETLCVCTSIYKHKHELCANIRKYIHTHL